MQNSNLPRELGIDQALPALKHDAAPTGEHTNEPTAAPSELRCSTAIPVRDLLDYLESEQKRWSGVNSDRYWQTTRILGFVQVLRDGKPFCCCQQNGQ